jgi:hypothetical protein
MRIEFMKIHPQLEKELNVQPKYHIVKSKDLDKLFTFLILNPRVLEAVIGKEEFDRQWNAKSDEKSE